MLLGFKRQFAPFVEEGSKTHTIRALRKIAPRVGETCHCYVDPRQKTMRLLGRFKCIRIEPITISESFNPVIKLALSIDGHLLSTDETEAFLWRDGFRDKGGEKYPAIHQAAAFWARRLADDAFHGQLIHWDFKEVVNAGR